MTRAVAVGAHVMRILSKAFVLVAFLALQACAVSTPVRVAVPQQSSLPEAVALDIGRQAGPAMNDFAASLGRELAKSGVSIRADAPYRLTLALSAQPSRSGLTADPGKDPKTIAWQAKPRRKGMFENCQAERLRVVAVGSRGLDARPPLVAEAELDSCKDKPAELDRLAAALAAAITRR